MVRVEHDAARHLDYREVHDAERAAAADPGARHRGLPASRVPRAGIRADGHAPPHGVHARGGGADLGHHVQPELGDFELLPHLTRVAAAPLAGASADGLAVPDLDGYLEVDALHGPDHSRRIAVPAPHPV